jgi:Zn finger protein HypA/HybF involved in hydrogenase expression
MRLQGSTASVLILACALAALPWSSARAAQEPEYPHGDFEDDCTLCHQSEAWAPAVISPSFDHSKHGFHLQGSHAQTNCRACHLSLEFDDAEPACVSCHSDVHQDELGTDCARCHTPRSFIDRSWMTRAHLTTRFPLRGTHRTVDCEDCHTPVSQGSLQWVNTPLDCESCHLEDYLATTQPDHQAAALPRTCESCHSPRAWTPAGFNHNTLPSGAQCVDCHLDDFQSATNPDHQGAGFSQQCEICHNTRAWVPSSFDGLNHDGQFFPIFSGKHKGKWNVCSECHVVPNNFANFECIQCHAHDDQAKVADQHSEVSGYQYDSQACFNCHPRGNAE